MEYACQSGKYLTTEAGTKSTPPKDISYNFSEVILYEYFTVLIFTPGPMVELTVMLFKY